jgi:vacuolar-type H+-ATPase catalytic subunit A/Vma1
MDDQDQPRCHINSGDNWNELNEMTLSVMANRTRYDRYKKTVANTSDAVADNFCKEKTYYKDRILAMTSGLFDERCENDDINRAHQEYIKSCSEYLKWNDVTEMVGSDTRAKVQEDIASARQELQKKIQETAVSAAADDDDDDDDETNTTATTATHQFQNDRIMSLANKMCIRKKTIDDFIVLKPSAGNTDEEINARLPKIRDYNSEIMKRADAAAASATLTETLS